jgi:hypothetical protein
MLRAHDGVLVTYNQGVIGLSLNQVNFRGARICRH